jgi:hypothetical protein
MRRKTGYIGGYITEELKRRLKAEAVQDHRTLMQQVEMILTRHLERRPSRQHTLVIIGHMGVKRAYLDVEPAEAKRRYVESEGMSEEEAKDLRVSFFAFEDEFGVYDAYPSADEPVVELVEAP